MTRAALRRWRTPGLVDTQRSIGCAELCRSSQLRAINIDQCESTTIGEQGLVPCCQGAIAGAIGNDQQLE